ncbi:hypothetical protein TraAM80_06650 [Trypanosoma rangeli]|uniref:Uncharacterized protein n=1 Tax=Trypanosoma rangeli TaxID=5698 RepID=A0A3R7KV50_TRYRA|nr:uncharacterized protein TraAM80_06650 [Trypanosoma rangeli]RNF01988.1 hypothetical protein TraAM80_06650 [Trypanosoma rangeli]|eukprot:RNF01988.1 hypothetical protein TraAM80_06650 [Trypanosoma rangeli]
MFERAEAAKLRRLLGIVTRHFRASHADGVGHSDVAGTQRPAHDAAMTFSAAAPSSSVGRMVVVVSSRKEQDAVFPQLLAGLRGSDAVPSHGEREKEMGQETEELSPPRTAWTATRSHHLRRTWRTRWRCSCACQHVSYGPHVWEGTQR